ncbi:MAG: proteasome beta subunit [Thermoproteota archaeon]|nr:proteasome beta subunit [Thermoproteota archaeon]
MGEMYLPGATTIGVACKNAVILASEKRVSYGYMIMSKTGKKVFRVTDQIGAACAGIMADMQILIRQMEAYSKLYELDHSRRISVRAAAKFISNILFQRRYFPYITQTIVGGVDDEGSTIYILDPLGSVIPDKFAAVGSGAEIAIGVLEAAYKDDCDLEEGKVLVIRAMKSALARDSASGNGVDLLLITPDGIKEESLAF